MKLPRAFYARHTVEVARDLLGMHLVRVDAKGRRRAGRIVETEAYRGPEDRAAHSWRGRTPRTAIMYGPPGYAYVFMIYGMYFCANVVTEPEERPCAVLLRAVEPIAGVEAKTNGPGLLCRALEIDRGLNGVDLCGDELFIERPGDAAARPVRVGKSARIGVDYAGRWAKKPWRFFDRDSTFVSGTSRGRRAS
jgi:DNA-3-methyladenine glycosylase